MDISHQLVARLNQALRQEINMEHFQARLRQNRVAAALGTNRKAMEGLGRVRMEVDSWAYHYWGQRLGYKCWRDQSFLREYERDNPNVRVRCRGTKEISVGYTPSPERVKFRKTYSVEGH